MVAGESVGWELLERQHADAATIGISVLVLSTGPRLLDKARAQAERYGAYHYLGKPVNLHDMLAAVREMIGEA